MASTAPVTIQPTQYPLGPSKSTSHLTSFSTPHPPLPSPILSRASSRVSFAPRPISSSKSASVLTCQPPSTNRKAQDPSPSTPLRPALKSSTNHTPTRVVASAVGEEWWLQTASALTLAAAESKGQAWLATRNSSTSLRDNEEADENDLHRVRSHDHAPGSSNSRARLHPLTPRYPPPASPYSTSRRGSVQLKQSHSNLVTFSPIHYEPLDEASLREDVIKGPMFVDLDNAEDERYLRRSYSERSSEADEEGEVRRLIRGRVGGWLDYFVGWMDFRGDDSWDGKSEDEEGGDEEDEEGREDYKDKKRKEHEGKTKASVERSNYSEKNNTKKVVEETDVEYESTLVTDSEEAGGAWTDAKWLLGAASKAIF